MDHADDGVGDGVFVYMGGEVPLHLKLSITHVRIHKSVKIITRQAFIYCLRLVSIEMHDGVEIIEEKSFRECPSLRNINLAGVRVIEQYAFAGCIGLEDIEFGNKLETIGKWAFRRCTCLRSIKLPKIRDIGYGAFARCQQLTDADFSEDLERIDGGTFEECHNLRRIAIPLKDNLLGIDVFFNGDALSQVDLVGGSHRTISSLLLNSWKNEMENEIDRINRDLFNTPADDKTEAIHQWMRSVLQRIEHYKSEHYILLKEFTTLLELALWDANLQQQEERLWLKWVDSKQPAKKAKIDIDAVRHETRVTSGANIVIKNVLPFLKLE